MERGNNCNVLGTCADEATHVSTITPMKLKKREYANDPAYQTDHNSDIDKTRETKVTKARREGDVRPLGGGIAK